MHLPAAAPAAMALVLAGCLSTSAPLHSALGPVPAPEPFTGLTDHPALLDRLVALAARGVVVEPIGQSVEGRDLHLVRVGHGPFELWLAARHHGNEPTSTEAVLNVLDYLLGARAPPPAAFEVTRELHEHRALLLERLTFVVVPMVNPDGAMRYQRHNVNGQDLNRDYLLFKEPEPRAVRDAFWRAWPDAGLDLHNEGLGEGFDYDAYYPEVPRAESDTQELSLRNQWTVVHEMEAAGSYAGGPNENYVTGSTTDPCQYLPASVPVPPPTGDTDPTAYCEGTHDAFLTLRGAPGWTPEAAIQWDTPDSGTIPWGVRQHEATIASTALLYAGLYDGCAPEVQKFAGLLNAQTTIPVTTAGPARFQLVWREGASTHDQHLEELDLAVRTPSGQLLGPETHPLGYTETLHSPEPGAHLATVVGRTPLPTPYELRVHACVPGAAGLAVAREGSAFRVANTGRVPLSVDLRDSAVDDVAASAEGAERWLVKGNLAPKTILAWRLDLAPGEVRVLPYALPEGVAPGPARWHAHGPGGEVLVGVSVERAGASPP